jgi:hypothetical protein
MKGIMIKTLDTFSTTISSSLPSPSSARFLNQRSAAQLQCFATIFSPPTMATSHPQLFQQSTVDESKITKFVANCFLPDRVVLQWCPVAGEDIPTRITNEIVVFSSFLQRGFVLSAYDFLWGLIQHYQIELVHLNPNSILQIVVLVHLCEAFLGIPPNFPLFKNYFFLKFQPGTTNQKVIDGVHLHTLPNSGFFDLPMKTSLQGGKGPGFIVKTMNPAFPYSLVAFLSSRVVGMKNRLPSNSPTSPP